MKGLTGEADDYRDTYRYLERLAETVEHMTDEEFAAIIKQWGERQTPITVQPETPATSSNGSTSRDQAPGPAVAK